MSVDLGLRHDRLLREQAAAFYSTRSIDFGYYQDPLPRASRSSSSE